MPLDAATKNDIETKFFGQQLEVLNESGLIWRLTNNDTSITTGNTITILALTTNNTPLVLERFSVQTPASKAFVRVFEGGVYTGGVAVPAINLNRIKNKVLDVTNLVTTPAVSPAGVLIIEHILRAGNVEDGQNVINHARPSGLILKPQTVYYVQYVNQDAASQTFDSQLEISELAV